VPPLGAHGVNEVSAPPGGFWRIGLATDPYESRPPLSAEELNTPRAGNRFDSPVGTYSVLYFGTDLAACFGETLSRFRPSAVAVEAVEADWEARSFMKPGSVPADWRLRRLAVRARPAPTDVLFLDVESGATRAFLQHELSVVLSAFGIPELDVPAIRGADRRLTRAISLWAYNQLKDDGTPRYAGIRYLSRLDTQWECWALFDRVDTQETERRSITRSMSELLEVAEMWGLTVF
jgi:hypothetical protein